MNHDILTYDEFCDGLRRYEISTFSKHIAMLMIQNQDEAIIRLTKQHNQVLSVLDDPDQTKKFYTDYLNSLNK